MDIVNELKVHGNHGSAAVAKFVLAESVHVPELVGAMASESKRVKNAAAKAVRIVSNEAPHLLLPFFDRFRDLLSQNDTILLWIATDVIGNLAAVVASDKFNKPLLARLFAMLADESMITASHAIGTLGKVAGSHDRFRTKITLELARVEKLERNAACRDILLGKVIDSYRLYYPVATKASRTKMVDLAQRQLSNPRGPTKKRAVQFVGKHSPTP